MIDNLILPIINGIADTLRALLPDADIYTDTPDSVQPNAAGYFYIQGPISITETRFLKDRHQLRLTFDVMYFPADAATADAGLLSGVAFAMTEGLYQITPAGVKDGAYAPEALGRRGFDCSATIVDGVVHVTTSYDLWLTAAEKKALVKSITITFEKNE